MSRADERRGGRGRTGGFGYLYNQEFAQPFENTLGVTMNTCKPPANSVFNAAVTTQILTNLKTTFADLSRPVHERLAWNAISTKQDACLY